MTNQVGTAALQKVLASIRTPNDLVVEKPSPWMSLSLEDRPRGSPLELTNIDGLVEVRVAALLLQGNSEHSELLHHKYEVDIAEINSDSSDELDINSWRQHLWRQHLPCHLTLLGLSVLSGRAELAVLRAEHGVDMNFFESSLLWRFPVFAASYMKTCVTAVGSLRHVLKCWRLVCSD